MLKRIVFGDRRGSLCVWARVEDRGRRDKVEGNDARAGDGKAEALLDRGNVGGAELLVGVDPVDKSATVIDLIELRCEGGAELGRNAEPGRGEVTEDDVDAGGGGRVGSDGAEADSGEASE